MNVQLPQPKNVSDEFFEQTRPEASDINGELATFEGLVDAERNVALVQWSQFIEHDLVKTVFQTMSKKDRHFSRRTESFIIESNINFRQWRSN